MPGGVVQVAQLERHLDIVLHAAPDRRDLAPVVAATSTICWTREISEAKVATMIRPSALREDALEASAPTSRSEGVKPGCLDVDAVGDQREHALAARNRPGLAEIGRPAVHRRLVELVVAGDGRSSPAGVVMPKPTASGIEWQTRNDSTLNAPACTGAVPSGSSSRRSAVSRSSLLAQLDADQAERQPAWRRSAGCRVRAAGTAGRRYGPRARG